MAKMEKFLLTAELLRHAERVLGDCKSLADAERELGGEWCEAKGRDRQAAAVTWGLFDGFWGRPFPDGGFALGMGLYAIYLQAVEAGRKLIGKANKRS